MTEHEAEIKAARAERDELEVENRVLREEIQKLRGRLREREEEIARTRRGVFGPRPAEAAL